MSILDFFANRNNQPLPRSMELGKMMQEKMGPMEPSVMGSIFGRGGADELTRMMDMKQMDNFRLRQKLMELLMASQKERAAKLPKPPEDRGPSMPMGMFSR